MLLRALALLFFAVPALLAQGGKLSLEALYHPTRKVDYLPAPPRYAWLPGDQLLETRVEKGQATLTRVDARSGERKPFLGADAVADALVKQGAPEAEAKRALMRPAWNEAMDAFVASLGGDFYLVRIQPLEARRLTRDGRPKDEPLFSPDGKKVAFLRANDLHALELESGVEIRLTRDGAEERLNGRLDWVYEEEIYDRGNKRAFWWSPDSRMLAFLQLDISKVPTHVLMDDRSQPQKQVPLRYPKAGDPNPVARLGRVDLQGTLAWMENPYPGQETLIVQVGWDPKNRLVAAFQDRIQSWLELWRFQGTKGASLLREQGKAWQDRLPLPRFLKDGSFLWLSDRSGFRHAYRHAEDGALLRQVTEGPWDVREIHGVEEPAKPKDAKKALLLFSGTERGPLGLDLYSVALEGKAPNARLERLSARAGTHQVKFGKSLDLYLDQWSDATTPPTTAVLAREGKKLLDLGGGASPAYAQLALGTVKFVQLKARDGAPLEGMLTLPPGFDSSLKYPVVQPVYGGPHAPTVRNAFGRGNLLSHFLAQQGYVVFAVDPRSASNHGSTSAHAAHRRLGEQELADLEDSVAWLGQQGWADLGRVAIMGTSYGGFMSAFALTHSTKWKVGVAGAPVTDWHLYDSVYTERYMGLPKDNPEGYARTSVLKAADRLQGRLLLLHGTLDDNVHPQHSIQALDAFQKAGKAVEFALVPGAAHGPRAPDQTWAWYRKIWEFLKGSL